MMRITCFFACTVLVSCAANTAQPPADQPTKSKSPKKPTAQYHIPPDVESEYPKIEERTAISWQTDKKLAPGRPKLRVRHFASYAAKYEANRKVPGIQIPPGAYLVAFECAPSPNIYDDKGKKIASQAAPAYTPYAIEAVLKEGVKYKLAVEDDSKTYDCRTPRKVKGDNTASIQPEVCGYYPDECKISFVEDGAL